MSLPVIIHRQAQREFDAASDWYEWHRAGLGVKFTAAVQQVLDEAAAHPQRYPQVYGEVREGMVPGFPYCVYYRLEAGHILVLAVIHTSRDPSIWQSRA
ncbi:MAG: type II toxin-antitoxin system RelE/ParE family toxin [Planctomycetes bacterium]|nr:type II toxin-antitoxin system RelE/ParE family toxin [Planctomycetota bacterium]